jgi:hypothetical protein
MLGLLPTVVVSRAAAFSSRPLYIPPVNLPKPFCMLFLSSQSPVSPCDLWVTHLFLVPVVKGSVLPSPSTLPPPADPLLGWLPCAQTSSFISQ